MTAALLLALVLASGDADAVRADLDVLDAKSDATRAELVQGAATAMDELPRAEGNLRAAALLDRTLRSDPAKLKGVWSHVQRLYRRVLEDGDTAAGHSFFLSLIDLYPEQESLYRGDLAWLLMDASRPREAREQFIAVLAADPSDLDAAREIASIDEMLGDPDAALERYRGLLDDHGDLRAGILRMNLLWRVRGEIGAARSLHIELRSMLNTLPEGEERTRLLADLEAESLALEGARRTSDGLRDLSERQTTWLVLLGACWAAALAGLGRWVSRAR